MGTSLALMLVAGGVGFGLVQILRGVAGGPAPHMTAQSMAPGTSYQATRTANAAPPSPAHAARLPEVAQPDAPPPAPAAPSIPPPVEVVIGQIRLQQPLPQMVTLPVAAPGPMGPEEFADNDSDVETPHWRRRPPPVARSGRTYVLPAPGGPDNSGDAEPIAPAQGPYSAAQGDAAADAASRKLAALLLAEAQGKPVAAVPEPDMAPLVTTELTVPASVRLSMPDDQPAARVDASAASVIDGARDAPARLLGLPTPPPEKLVVPEYPEALAVEDRPGRVAVGCTISIRGEPTDCQVRAHAGGTSFVSSVLDWLHSGAVRYKPHFIHGTAVPEARLYKVRFEP